MRVVQRQSDQLASAIILKDLMDVSLGGNVAYLFEINYIHNIFT